MTLGVPVCGTGREDESAGGPQPNPSFPTPIPNQQVMESTPIAEGGTPHNQGAVNNSTDPQPPQNNDKEFNQLVVKALLAAKPADAKPQ